MAADVDRSYLGGIERGEHNPTFMTLWRVARAREVPLSRLVRDADL